MIVIDFGMVGICIIEVDCFFDIDDFEIDGFVCYFMFIINGVLVFVCGVNLVL